MEEEPKDKKEYEISFVLASEDGSADIEKELASVGAEITLKSPAASVRLAYPLKRHETAYFGYMHFMADPGSVKLIKTALAHNAKVLRSLILTPAVKPLPREARPSRLGESGQARPAVSGVKEKRSVVPASESKPAPEKLMTNEALEKKLEEILK